MAKSNGRSIIGTEICEGYTPVHPALDFWDDRAIVSVGEPLKRLYNDGSVDFIDGEMTILNDGTRFIYSRQELAKHMLYYTRGLDLPPSRWELDDLKKYCEGMQNGHKPTIDIEKLYKVVRDTWEFYMDFEHEVYYDVLAAFTLYTYFYPLFESAPILQLFGEYSTGKSKICKLIEAMAFNPVNSANISEASVFRLIESRRSVIIFDESEDLMTSDRGRAICNLLLAGYSKGGETYRQEKMPNDKYKTMNFKVFSPKVIANIAGINLAPLLTRVIRLVTTGASNKEKGNRDVKLIDPVFKEIRNQLYRMALLHFVRIEEARDNLSDNLPLSQRALGISQGILSVVRIACNSKFDDVLAFMVSNATALKDELDTYNSGAALIKRLTTIVADHGDKFYTCAELFDMLRFDENLNIDNVRTLGHALQRIGVTNSKVLRTKNGVYRGYELTMDWLIGRLDRA